MTLDKFRRSLADPAPPPVGSANGRGQRKWKK